MSLIFKVGELPIYVSNEFLFLIVCFLSVIIGGWVFKK